MDSNFNQTYINILVDSLERKQHLLEEIQKITKEQTEILEQVPFKLEAFEQTLEEKANKIKEIQKLDEGFSILFQKVKEEIKQNKIKYQNEIKKAQSLIETVTDLGVQIQALEAKNKIKMQIYLSDKRKEIKEYKLNSKTASKYYKNMANQYQGQSYFLDKKK